VGEPFSFFLTCSVLESDSVKVVPDQTALEPSVVQMPPFEVIGGSHGPDLKAGERRFFQYEYQMRLIGEDLFGKDVAIPSMKISYKVQSRVAQGSSVEGRDRVYVLPSESVRVLSLVPADATAIRDGSAENFSEIDSRVFRSNVLLVLAGTLFALAMLVAVLVVVHLARRYREARPVARRMVGDSAVLRTVGRELAAIESERAGSGWTEELAGRALAAVRVAGSYLVVRRIIETAPNPLEGGADQEGRLRVRPIWPPGREILVSSSLTGEAVAKELARTTKAGLNGHTDTSLQELATAITTLTSAWYGWNGTMNTSALDESLSTSQRIQKQMARRHTWLAKRLTALKRAALPKKAAAWGR
jgi:hypothetical protein